MAELFRTRRQPMDVDITLMRGFLWWRRPVVFRGSCTVWHELETGRRAPTHTELQLCDIWWRMKNAA
jgi:hypothetical protein